MKAVFLRALDPDPEEKGAHLRAAVERLKSDAHDDGETSFVVDTEEFGVLPESPFAYWVGEPIRRIFREFPPLEGSVGTVKVGLQTSDDFRFLRLWWEVPPERLGFSPEDTETGRGWVHFAKGGSYSPYYADVHLVVNWFGRGAEIRSFDRAYIRNEDFYFRPGLTWPHRTKRLAPRAFPTECIFSHTAKCAFPREQAGVSASDLVGLFASLPFFSLVKARLEREGDSRYEVGIIQKTPSPSPIDVGHLGAVASSSIVAARELQLYTEPGHSFSGTNQPASVSSISEGMQLEETRRRRLKNALAEDQAELDARCAQIYGLSEADVARLRSWAGVPLAPEQSERASEDPDGARRLEGASSYTASFLMWCVGVVFGRWDVRMAIDRSLVPKLPNPFARLPRVAPAALLGPDGWPATPDRIASEAWLRARPDAIGLPEPDELDAPAFISAADYPVEIAWNGVVVDDPDHEWDIIRKVREVLQYIYGEQAGAIEEEAVQVLRGDGRTPSDLRDWFRNRTATELGQNFVDFHIRRYSKSRRKAPIYWRLCTSPGRGQSDYGVWLYYPRLTDDTLWTVLNQYVAPKLDREERKLEDLRSRAQNADGRDRTSLESEAETTEGLLDEIRWFEGEIRKVAQRGYAPDLDDGVVINMAPLHEVVPWKEPEKIWKRLQKGEYDWAKMAMRYWPDRVREKCADDKSLAIAHGLEISE